MHSKALTQLADKLSTKSFTLGVIGLGYVGLPLRAHLFAQRHQSYRL